MTDFMDNESDEAIARSMGLSLAEFRGEVPFEPVVDWSSLPCGTDDMVGEQINAAEQMIYLKREWEDTPWEDTGTGELPYKNCGIPVTTFKEFVAELWEEGYWVEEVDECQAGVNAPTYGNKAW